MCIFLCIQALSNQKLQQYSVNGKSTIQCQQMKMTCSLNILQPVTHSTSTWFKSIVTLTDREAKHLSYPKIIQLNRLCTVGWKCLSMVTCPQMHFFTVKVFQGSNLHKFSHHGLMRNFIILVMGPMLGFKLAVICLLQGFCSLIETTEWMSVDVMWQGSSGILMLSTEHVTD
jgi:hypothetical protein